MEFGNVEVSIFSFLFSRTKKLSTGEKEYVKNIGLKFFLENKNLKKIWLIEFGKSMKNRNI